MHGMLCTDIPLFGGFGPGLLATDLFISELWAPCSALCGKRESCASALAFQESRRGLMSLKADLLCALSCPFCNPAFVSASASAGMDFLGSKIEREFPLGFQCSDNF